MLDIISAEDIGKGGGIEKALPASSLPNFRRVAPKQAMAQARVKNAILHCPQYELEDGAFKELSRSGGALVFSFSDLLSESGFRRAIALSKMRLALAQCRRAGCGFCFCTLAQSEIQLRSARELEAFMSVLGLTQHEKSFAERTLGRLAAGKAEKS